MCAVHHSQQKAYISCSCSMLRIQWQQRAGRGRFAFAVSYHEQQCCSISLPSSLPLLSLSLSFSFSLSLWAFCERQRSYENRLRERWNITYCSDWNRSKHNINTSKSVFNTFNTQGQGSCDILICKNAKHWIQGFPHHMKSIFSLKIEQRQLLLNGKLLFFGFSTICFKTKKTEKCLAWW